MIGSRTNQSSWVRASRSTAIRHLRKLEAARRLSTWITLEIIQPARIRIAGALIAFQIALRKQELGLFDR